MTELLLPIPDDLINALVQKVTEQQQAASAPRYVSKERLADRLGVSERTLKTWRSRGMPGVRVGREVMYEIDAVDRWIEEQS